MSGPLLDVRALSKHFGGVQAATDVHLSVDAGSITSVIGPNGAGKSTLMAMLSGHSIPDSGNVFYEGRDVTKWPAHRRASAGVVRKFQRPAYFPGLSVVENLEIGVVAAGIRGGRAMRSRAREVADIVQLDDARYVTAGSLPHGRTQWLEIGLLLACRARVMLLDEPTAGMTRQETADTATLIHQLVHDLDMAFVVVEHDIDFVRSLDSQVTVLHLGQVIATGSMSDVEQDAQTRLVYLGE
jgi:urea transport system ATP-binding protein